MAVLISKNDRLGLGLNTLTRNIVYAILALRGLTRSITAYKDFINIAFSQTGDDDSIDLTFNASVKLLVQAEAVGTEGFNRLDYIKNLSELTPDNPPALVAVDGVNPLPDNPEGLTLEKFIYWAGIVLGCSTYPSTDYYKETFEDKPSTGDPYLTLEFVIPLDYRRYLLNQNAIAASIQPFTVYVTDPASLPSTPWVIPPSSQYWKDPVANLTALTALTGLPIGVSVPVLSEGSVFTLISALPDGETLGANFLEPDTQSATEVWARSVGKTGPQGEPGTPGVGVTWRGEWNSGSAYVVQDAVGHLGSSWIANAPNTNKTPGTDPEWDLWVSKGNSGATGADGAAGNDGLTAYEVAVLNGFEGTEQAWLGSLKGDPGDPGPAGTISFAGSVTLEHIATPSAPSAGNTLIYAKADGGIYKRAAGGNEEAIGSGGGNGNFSPLTDKALYYYDAGSGLFKPIGIGTLGQTLIAQPLSNPPYQWATPTSREVLTANRTYYVRTDGSDNNDGLSNTAGGAFLTIQKFFDTVEGIDRVDYTITGEVADGTYNVTNSIIIKEGVGSGLITLKGNSSTPTNVVVQSGNNITLFYKSMQGLVEIDGIKVQSTGSTASFVGFNVAGGILRYKNVDFGAMTTGDINAGNSAHLFVVNRGSVLATGNSTISGNAGYHMFIFYDGIVLDDYLFNPASPISSTLTLNGTRAFTYFVRLLGGEYRQSSSRRTIIGTATGIRYSIAGRGICVTGGGANYFPGNVAGTVETATYSYYS